MDCKKIRDLLKTDYLDERLEAGLRKEVEEHLKICHECRSLEEEIRRLALLPFKDAARPEAPQRIWVNIAEKIAERQSQKRSLLDLLKEKLQVFTLPAPALAFASTAVILMAAVGVITKHNIDRNQINDYFSRQISFYSALDNGALNGNGQDSADLGTSVESYLF